jgi:hypothetical protein
VAVAVVEASAAAAISPVETAAAMKALRRSANANKLSTMLLFATDFMWMDQRKVARSLAQEGLVSLKFLIYR